jgi:hypothetical protein
MISMVKEYPQYSFLNLSYADERESEEIFKRNLHRMDVCLFTGPWPYTKVLSALGPSGPPIPMVYANHTSGLYQAIARMLINGANLNRISIDVISEEDAETAFTGIGFRPKNLYLMPFRGAVPRERFIEFHRDLWKQGRTDSMITRLTSAYNHLKEEGLPVYHSSVDLVSMREAVARAVLELQSVKLQEQQLAVGLIDAVEPYTEKDSTALQQALVEYGNKEGLAVVPLDGHRFALFLTRGSHLKLTSRFKSFALPEKLSSVIGSRVCCGLGVGPTVNTCYSKAVMALGYASKAQISCAYVMFDGGEVYGPLVGSSAGLAYSRRSVD